MSGLCIKRGQSSLFDRKSVKMKCISHPKKHIVVLYRIQRYPFSHFQLVLEKKKKTINLDILNKILS